VPASHPERGPGSPTVKHVGPWARAGLVALFEALLAAGDEPQFHPHPLTASQADRICSYRGLDEYHVAVNDGVIVGYGMLRGWGEGHAVPSLGIAVHPEHRHRGIGRLIMEALHQAARARGAAQVRLRVRSDNEVAINLYRSLGYELAGHERGQLVLLLDLRSRLR